MWFDRNFIKLSLKRPGYKALELTILCKAPDWQLSSLTQFCDSFFLSLCNFERLDIRGYSYSRRRWKKDVEHTQWLELLHPFATVKSLSLPKEFALRVVRALQELSGERIMGVLPALQEILIPVWSPLLGSFNVKKAFAQFITARQLSGHPVTVAVIPARE
jgi:hypothetical protein